VRSECRKSRGLSVSYQAVPVMSKAVEGWNFSGYTGITTLENLAIVCPGTGTALKSYEMTFMNFTDRGGR